MENAGRPEGLIVDVIGAESIVAAGAMQKHTICTAWAQNEAIGGYLSRNLDHAPGEIAAASTHDSENHLTKIVVSYLAHESGGDPEFVQRKTGIGHGTARAQHCRADLLELSRIEHEAVTAEGRDDIQAYVACHNRIASFMHNPPIAVTNFG